MDSLREGDALLPMHEEQRHIIKLVPTGGVLFQRRKYFAESILG